MNPYETSIKHIYQELRIQKKNHASDEDWGRCGPDEKNDCDDPKTLPLLCSYKIVNPVNIPYNGVESAYTWHQNLCSIIQEYGVLLLNIEEFKLNKSLCAKKYYGPKSTLLGTETQQMPYINYYHCRT